jgi:biotin carboxylase
MDDELVSRVQNLSGRLLEATGFVGVGSFDFLWEGDRVFFLGGHARLTPSLLLWGALIQNSPVEYQLSAFNSEKADLPIIQKKGSMVSVRISAEDPFLELPRPGLVEYLPGTQDWKFIGGEAHLHWNIEKGKRSAPWLGTLVVSAGDRKSALHIATQLLQSGAAGCSGGLQTNERYLLQVLEHPWVREEVFHASFLEEEFIPSFSISVEEWRGLGESILFNLKSEVLGSFVFAEKVKLKVPEKMPEGWQWIEPGILKYGNYPPANLINTWF